MLPTVMFGGRSVLLWGCVASTGTGNLVKVEGCMDSAQYEQILEANFQDSIKKLKGDWGWLLEETQIQHSGMAITVPRFEHHREFVV